MEVNSISSKLGQQIEDALILNLLISKVNIRILNSFGCLRNKVRLYTKISDTPHGFVPLSYPIFKQLELVSNSVKGTESHPHSPSLEVHK